MKKKVFGIGFATLFVFLFSFGCSGVEAELENKNTEIEELTKRVVNLEEENKDLIQRTTDYDARVRALDARVGVLTVENNKLRDEMRNASASYAKIEISTDPEKLVCENGNRKWELILKEVNGVGISINKVNRKYYYPTGEISGEATNTSSSCEWLPAYIPPNGEFSVKSGAPCGRCTGNKEPNKIVYLIEGVDDNGHQITTTETFLFD